MGGFEKSIPQKLNQERSNTNNVFRHIETKYITQTNNLIKPAGRFVAERMRLRTTENRTVIDRRVNKKSYKNSYKLLGQCSVNVCEITKRRT